MSQKKRNANANSLLVEGEQHQRNENASEKKAISLRASQRKTKPPSWLSAYYTNLSKSTPEKKTREGENHQEEDNIPPKNNNLSKKRKIVKWKSWNEMYDRDNKAVRIAEEMGITPKVPNGGYDTRVFERMRTYDQNEPINLSNDDNQPRRQQTPPSNHIPLDNADVNQSGPSTVPALPQNFPLVPLQLQPAEVLFAIATILLQNTEFQTSLVAHEVTPSSTPHDHLQIMPPPTNSEVTSSRATRTTRNQPRRFNDDFM